MPGEEYKVSLEVFEGPLDLLLYLIKKDELDIFNIPIEHVTKQYLGYVDMMKMLDLNIAGEFLVMAATLMMIKSRMLLPVEDRPELEDEEDDPRWELVRQLVEYKKFKEAASFLGVQEVKSDEFFATTPELPDLEAPVVGIGQVGIFDLIRAFQRILKRFENASDFREIVNDRFTVADKIEELLTIVPVGGRVRFEELFNSSSSRGEVIITFLAMLELIKLNHLQVEQEQLLGDIVIVRPQL